MPVALVRPGDTRVFDVALSPFSVAAPLIWISCSSDVRPDTHTWQDGVFTLAPTPTTPLPASWPLLKSTIRARLRAAGLEDAADSFRATLSAAAQNGWSEAVYVENTDPVMIAFLTAIGSDPEQILAYDPNAARLFGR